MRRRREMTAVVKVVRSRWNKSEPLVFLPSVPLQQPEDWQEPGVPVSPVQQFRSLAVVLMELRSIASAIRRITDPYRGDPETICIEKDELARRLFALADSIEGRATRG